MRLRDWLTEAERAPERSYAVADVTETDDRPADLLPYLAELMARAKIDPIHLERMVASLGWEAVRARLVPGGSRVRRGEFGEALSAAILEELEGWIVPIVKLRYQVDPEQTQPGTDLLALHTDGTDVDDMLFGESKLRGALDNQAAVDAHDQLAEDESKEFADILVFVMARLLEQRSDLIDPLTAYLARRDAAARGSYGIFLTFEDAAWRESVLDRLDDEPDLLDPLGVRVTRLDDLRDLADSACAAAGLDVVDDDD
jgi:hypothetical protein